MCGENKNIFLILSLSLLIICFPGSIYASSGPGSKDESSHRITTYQDEISIAIFDIKGIGISDLAAQTLSDHLLFELKQISVTTPVGPAKIREILEQRGFQNIEKTSIKEVREACSILGVKQVIMGSFGKIFDKYVIDLRLYAVESGAIEKSITQTYSGNVDGLIMEIERLAWNILNQTPPPNRFSWHYSK